MTGDKWRTLGLLAGIFVLGGITGAAAMRVHVNRDVGALLEMNPAEAQQKLKLRALARRLGLSNEQKAKIGQILRAQRDECKSVEQRTQEELTQCREKALPAAAEILSPEQRVKLDQILRRQGRRGLAAPADGPR